MPFQFSTLRCRVSRNGTCEDGMEVCLSSRPPASFWPDSDCRISKIMHTFVSRQLWNQKCLEVAVPKKILFEKGSSMALWTLGQAISHTLSLGISPVTIKKTSCWTKYCLVEAELLNWTRSIWRTVTRPASCDCHRQAEDHDCNKEVTFVRTLPLH